MSSAVHVLVAGLQTTVQDLGRWGHQSIGMPVAGPMNPFAHRLANALVGNERSAASLEVTLVGPALQFDDSRVVAITGADFELFLDDQPVSASKPHLVRAGAVLRFGARRAGAPAYVGVSGGFDAPVVLGSRATHVPTLTGGWNGRALMRGDRLPVGESTGRIPGLRATRRSRAAHAGNEIEVRVLPGPQADRFASGALDLLTGAPYEVTVDSNRMGYRLAGAPLGRRDEAEIIRDATPIGSLQVPASGQPLLLMADRQTTGGYPKIATVITADIGVAGQAAPGDRLRFRICTHADAISALVVRERPLLALESEAR